MVSSEDEPDKFAGFSETVSRVIQAVLGVFIFMSTILTVYISPYYTISVAVVLIIALLAFLTLKNKHSTERYKARLQQQLEIERARLYRESTQPLLNNSSKAGAIRNAKFAMSQAITEALQDSIKDTSTPEEERKVYEKIVRRIKDMEKLVMQIW